VFSGKKKADHDKLRGGYYTPPKLASYLCDWSIRSASDKVIEPSCGDGNFVVAALKRFGDLDEDSHAHLTAIELQKEEIQKAKMRVIKDYSNQSSNLEWKNEDFFIVYGKIRKSSYDVVLGNPPFIRFQHFDEFSRDIAFNHLREVGYKPTKLANCWAAFVQLSIELLKPKGRLAMVIPAELLQVKYAAELRERITQSFEHIVLISFKKLVFKDIQQEVVLVLAEGKRISLEEQSDIHTIEIEDENQLDNKTLTSIIKHSTAKHTKKDVKWTSLFLKEEEFKAIDSIQHNKKLLRLGELVSVDVGIVTGRNKFFVVDNHTRDEYELSEFVTPLVGRTNAINNIVFDKQKLKDFSDKHPSNLLSLKGIDEKKFTKGLAKYIALGEQEEVHTGYKCRIRKRWYDVPSTHVSDGFLFRQIHKYPLLVSNAVNAACTDTIHRVQLFDKSICFTQLSASFINSLTFAWSEVCGRSYGGGVLELEPNEAEELPIPFNKDIELDIVLIRKLIESKDIEAVMDYVDEILLIKGLGMSKRRVQLLRSSWKRLSSKRLNRK
jgi:adenine-specific DNA-methyltransferase